MDIASLIGLIGGIGMILGAMISGGGIAPFVDVPSILIVFGGTAFLVLYAVPMPVFLGHFGAMAKAFLPPIKKMDELIERMVELSGIARKDGMMALEGQEVPDKFFQKGLQMLVDGADEAKLVTQLNKEIKAMKNRREVNQNAVKAWIDIAPAMGMVGTLIGLVLMLGNMSDPKAIGPAMAVNLLSTLYGLVIYGACYCLDPSIFTKGSKLSVVPLLLALPQLHHNLLYHYYLTFTALCRPFKLSSADLRIGSSIVMLRMATYISMVVQSFVCAGCWWIQTLTRRVGYVTLPLRLYRPYQYKIHILHMGRP